MFWRQCACSHYCTLCHDLQFSHLRWPCDLQYMRWDRMRWWYLVTSSLQSVFFGLRNACNDSQAFNGYLNNISIVSLPIDLAKCLMKLLSFSSTFTSESVGNDCTGTKMNNWLSSPGRPTDRHIAFKWLEAWFSTFPLDCILSWDELLSSWSGIWNQMEPRSKIQIYSASLISENASQKLVLWMIGKDPLRWIFRKISWGLT